MLSPGNVILMVEYSKNKILGPKSSGRSHVRGGWFYNRYSYRGAYNSRSLCPYRLRLHISTCHSFPYFKCSGRTIKLRAQSRKLMQHCKTINHAFTVLLYAVRSAVHICNAFLAISHLAGQCSSNTLDIFVGYKARNSWIIGYSDTDY
jgi:hypothetical protein